MRTIRISVLLAFVLFSLHSTLSSAQTFTVLHGFSTNADGQSPSGGVTLSGSTLYGTSYQGDNGSDYDSGIIYSVSTNGSNYMIVHSFDGLDGQNPTTIPVVSGNMIYGTCYSGGSNSDGVIYSVQTSGSNFTVMYAFDNGIGGTKPDGDLLLEGGTLYGTASYSDLSYDGSVYSIPTAGGGFTVLHSFTNNLGNRPFLGRLVLSGSTLYGTTDVGGTNNGGTIYCVSTNGSNFNVLYEFSQSNGIVPAGDLVLTGNTLYGTTAYGGSNGFGTVFAYNLTNGSYQQLHAFAGAAGSDGATPECTLTLSGNTLYGTTENSGSGLAGTIFSIGTDGTGYKILYNFNSSTDGATPTGTLLLSGSTLYGTTVTSGPGGAGTLYSLTLASSQPPPPSPFFTSQIALGSEWYYLHTGATYGFGYYNMTYYPYINHLDLGWEYFIDAADGAEGAYFYDFADEAWVYTNPAVFPNLYDFHLNTWVWYYPQNGSTDNYTMDPRSFYNYTTQTNIGHL